MKTNKETQSVWTGCELMCTGNTSGSSSRWTYGPCCVAEGNSQTEKCGKKREQLYLTWTNENNGNTSSNKI